MEDDVFERIDGKWLKFPAPLSDSTCAPIYYNIVLSVDQITEEAYEQRLALTEQWWKAVDHPLVWISDMTRYNESSASRRQLYAQYLDRIRPYQREHMLGAAIIASDAKQKGVSMAVHWISKTPTYPETYITTLQDAVSWCRERLSEANIDPGPKRLPSIKPEQFATGTG